MSREIKYGWRDKYSSQGVSADAARARLDALRERLGRAYSAEDVLKDTEADESSPLRPIVFDCKPAVAAHRYYLDRAGGISSAIVQIIVHETPDGERYEKRPVFIHVRDYGTDRVEVIAQDEDLAPRALREMLGIMDAYKQKVLFFEELMNKTEKTELVQAVEHLSSRTRSVLENAGLRRKRPE